MITVSNLGMQFGGQWLFQHVDLQFLPGNCYGIIGANGAGKSTFLRILTGELDSTTGSISIDPDKRVSVLKQNQNAYDEYTILDTVIMGNQHLYDVMKEKDAIYEKPDFSDEDGLRAADLEAEFAEYKALPTYTEADELETYRRAERTERLARERAAQIYTQANAILAEATLKVDDAAIEMADQLEAWTAVANSAKNALQEAAGAMYAIRPED